MVQAQDCCTAACMLYNLTACCTCNCWQSLHPPVPFQANKVNTHLYNRRAQRTLGCAMRNPEEMMLSPQTVCGYDTSYCCSKLIG